MAKATNTFRQGIDQDTSKNKYDNEHYYDANNVRIYTQDGLTSGALEDINGTIERIDLSALEVTGVIRIVGYTVLRDKIILFLTTNPTETPNVSYLDYIIQVPIEDLENLTTYNKYIVDADYAHLTGDVIYKENLEFCIANPIKAIPRYETENIQKIYWTDDYNKLRWLNTVWNEDTNDLTTLPIDRLEVIGDISLTQPKVTQGVSGNLRSGKVQYSYQLYMLNGSQTVYSPASKMYHITEAVDDDPNSIDYFGSLIDVNTGKGFYGEIDIDIAYYTRVRIIAIHYITDVDEPEIRIIEETDIDPNATKIYFSDVGQSIGNLILEEVRLLSTSLFIAGDIETKDNILFAGNIKADQFDVEFDARTYRFGGINSDPAIDQVSIMYEGDTSFYTLDGITKLWTYSGGGGPTSWTLLPPDADLINKFNDIRNDQDTTERFEYKSDGTTRGGEGPLVSYVFVPEVIVAFNTLITDPEIYQVWTELDGGDPDNYSYTGYESPIIDAKWRSYHRDEVYRFGIVFFDIKGRSSFVKWIGDIRMPSASDFPLGWGALGIEFYVDTSSIDSQIESYQIVRVKRAATDRSVVAQGILVPPVPGAPDELHHTALYAGAVTPTTEPIYEFMSPEVSFNKNLQLRTSSDYIQAIGTVNRLSWSGNSVANRMIVSKYGSTNGYTFANSILDDKFTDLEEGFIVKQSESEVLIGSFTYLTAFSNNNTVKGLFFLLEATNTTFVAQDIHGGDDYTVVNYRRDVFESQYGGNTRSARHRNLYITAGPIVDKDILFSTHEVFDGDTYFSHFDCLYSSHIDGTARFGDLVRAESFYIPLETSINLPLRNDDCYSRVYEDVGAELLHDTAGTWSDDASYSYVQQKNLYIYNPVYSRENDAKIFVDKPFDWVAQENFDVRVYNSDLKTNGELSDSWLNFRTDSFIEVDPQFGPLTALKTAVEKLMFFQTNAFGVLSVNERALLQTVSQAELVLGSTGVLDRYDYAKTNVGCYHWRHIVLSRNGLYWTDLTNKSMYSYGQGLEETSMIKGLDSWFRDNLAEPKDFTRVIGQAMHMFHDPDYNEVYLVDNTADFSLIYSELTKGFQTFTDYQPIFTVNYLDKVLGFTDTHLVHRHSDWNAERRNIYGTFRDASVTLLINPAAYDIGIFNNFEWLTEAFDISQTYGPVDAPRTWTSLTMWNDYQNTGEITLTVGENVKRRMRKWRFTIPRAKFERSVLRPPQPERYARMRDTHLFAKFVYSDVVNYRRFTIHDVITSHTISNS